MFIISTTESTFACFHPTKNVVIPDKIILIPVTSNSAVAAAAAAATAPPPTRLKTLLSHL